MNIPLTNIVEAWLANQPVSEKILAIKELGIFEQVLSQDKSLRLFILSPQVEEQKKLSVLEQVGISPLTIKFVGWINREQKWAQLSKLVRASKSYLKRIDETTEVNVISTIELDEKLKTELSEKLTKAVNSQVHINASIDPSILGGLIVDVKGKRYDSSLRGRLNQMKKSVNKLKIV